MYLKKLYLHNFRNYKKESFTFSPGINIIQGGNGEGKTNLLEAINFLSTGRSFRTSFPSELIKRGEKHFYLEASFIKDEVLNKLTISFDGTNRTIQYNQSTYSSFSHLLGILPSVLLTPQDLLLVTGSPANRRRFIDIQISQTNKSYLHNLARYHRAMKQRNILLKKKQIETIGIWEHEMAKASSDIMIKRKAMLSDLNPLLKQLTLTLSKEEEYFDLNYLPSISSHSIDEIELCFQKEREKELIMGITQIGPHRDDFLLKMEGESAKAFSSEGQKRTCITGLKLAQWELLDRLLSDKPLMSIDDFGIHLDAHRIKELHNRLTSHKQVFLTTPLSYEIDSSNTAQVLQIKGGKLL